MNQSARDECDVLDGARVSQRFRCVFEREFGVTGEKLAFRPFVTGESELTLRPASLSDRFSFGNMSARF